MIKEPKILANKPDSKVLNLIRHYMVNIITVEEEFDVYRFKKEVDSIVEKDYPRKNLIFAGGSGLYIKILLKLNFSLIISLFLSWFFFSSGLRISRASDIT